MADKWSNVNDLTGQGRKALQLAALNDSTDLPDIPKALYFDVAGTVNVMAVDDTVAVQFTVAAGVFDAVRVKRILSTGTTTITAANIKLIY